MRVGGKRHAPAALLLEPIPKEAGWAPEPVWTVGENFSSTGIQSSDLPVRSKLLYRLKIFIHFFNIISYTICFIFLDFMF